jgi:hypothetical protein
MAWWWWFVVGFVVVVVVLWLCISSIVWQAMVVVVEDVSCGNILEPAVACVAVWHNGKTIGTYWSSFLNMYGLIVQWLSAAL